MLNYLIMCMFNFIYSVPWIIGGIIVWNIVMHKFFASGTLKIDRTDPEKDIYRLDLDNLDNLHKKKRVVLNVENDVDLSHE